MKTKRALLVVESTKAATDRAFREMKKPSNKYAGMTILSFPNFEILGRVISPARLELLSVIRKDKPKSIQALSRLVKRDFKNVYHDVKALAEAGLIDLKEQGKGRASTLKALYEELVFAA
jgi:predicted transcriptional regulator